MKFRILVAGAAALASLLALSGEASAAACVNGVYRAGCAGPNGAVAVRKAPPPPPPTVVCAKGVYRAGCAGPNGAVVKKRY